MDRFFQDNSGIVLGASVVVFIEVFRLMNNEERTASLSLSAPFVKLYLQELALTASSLNAAADDDPFGSSSVGIQWMNNSNDNDSNANSSSTPKNNEDPKCKGTSHGSQLRSGYLFLRQTNIESAQSEEPPVVHLPSQNPLDVEPIPCRLVGYAIDNYRNALQPRREHNNTLSDTAPAMITDGTLVRIMPHSSSSLSYIQHNLDELVGETECSPMSKELEEELVHNHNPETIRELSLRMSLQLSSSKEVYIGTTADAFAIKRQQDQRKQAIANRIRGYCKARTNKYQPEVFTFNNENDNDDQIHRPPQHHHHHPSNNYNTPMHLQQKLPSIMMREGALLVHCPNHGTGKTALVQMIAQRHLNCTRVHVIQPGPLLAKYGSQADAALESILHAIVMSAAVVQQTHTSCSICIILDHFDSMMPPQCSAKSSSGDAAAPVLNAIAAYLKVLILSLKRKREFLFPSKNPLYNVGGRFGEVLAVKVCLVAVVTSPDDGWRSAQSSDSLVGRSSTCLLDVLPLGTYRLPASSAETRLKAFEFAFQKEQLVLTEEARKRLPLLAASAVWCRGKMFQCVAKRLRQELNTQRTNSNDNETVADHYQELSSSGVAIGAERIENALAAIGKGTSAHSDISFLASEHGQKDRTNNTDAFFFVGGNSDAKRSLEDALALDPIKRALLNSMGVGSPIAVLLYGPPGCGKTLLAKAVARLLRAPGAATSHIGGAFVSLNSSEIVQSTVGSSEKLIVSTFQTARENAPSVIFIDEFQALFTERSSSGNGKLTSTLLQCMDDIKLWRDSNRKASQDNGNSQQTPERESSYMDLNDNVLVLGATNTPWMVDKAFLRPGRFDRLVHVGLPSGGDRQSILYVHMSKMKVKDDKGIQNICKNLAQKTHGFSGADLAALCRAAAVRSLLETSEWIEERHFLEELSEGFVASSSAPLVQRNEIWRP